MYISIKNYFAVAGILITIGAWFVTNHSDYPFVYRIIAPDYYDAKEVTEIIRSSDGTKDFDFKPGQRGFRSLQKFLSINLRSFNGNSFAEQNYSIEEVVLYLQIKAGQMLGGMGWGPQGAELITPDTKVGVKYVGEDHVVHNDTVSIPDLANKLPNFHLANLDIICQLLFWIGIVLTVVSTAIDIRKEK